VHYFIAHICTITVLLTKGLKNFEVVDDVIQFLALNTFLNSFSPYVRIIRLHFRHRGARHTLWVVTVEICVANFSTDQSMIRIEPIDFVEL